MYLIEAHILPKLNIMLLYSNYVDGDLTLDIKINLKLDVESVRDPIVIAGLPGMGLTGKQAVDHLIEEFKAKKVGNIKAPFLSSPVITTNDGLVSDMLEELFTFYYSKIDGQSFIFFTGITQPPSPEWQHNLSRIVVDKLAEYGPQIIYTLAATPIYTYKWDVAVYGVATKMEILEDLKFYGVIPMTGEGVISGVNGLLIGYGKRLGIDGVVLMGETYLTTGRDYLAPLALVRTISRIFDVEVDTSKLERLALAFHEEISRALSKKKGRDEEGSLGYIS